MWSPKTHQMLCNKCEFFYVCVWKPVHPMPWPQSCKCCMWVFHWQWASKQLTDKAVPPTETKSVHIYLGLCARVREGAAGVKCVERKCFEVRANSRSFLLTTRLGYNVNQECVSEWESLPVSLSLQTRGCTTLLFRQNARKGYFVTSG